MKGCKPEISCGNSLTNPCNANAQCITERDGSVTCQVSLPVSGLNSGPSAFIRDPEGLSCLLSVELAGPVMDTCVGRTRTSTATLTRS